MPIRFRCQDCQKTYDVPETFAGKRVKCKECGNVLQVPGGPATSVTAAPPTARPAPPRRADPPRAEAQVLADKTPSAADEGIPPLFIKLIAGILVIGVIACVIVVYSARSKPVDANKTIATAPPAASQVPGPTDDSSPVMNPVTPKISASTPAPAINFPDRPSNPNIREGVRCYDIQLTGDAPGLPMQMYLYLPTGRDQPHSLPCVFIAPAGTPCIYCSALGEDDRHEHFPYARAGFAVLAYELSGAFPGDPQHATFGQLKEPIRQFMAAGGGLANEKMAVDYVLAKVAEVDPSQLYAAGHSSAGTMALNAVAFDHRLRAVAAYAPATHLAERLGSALPKLNRLIPGVDKMVDRVSPDQHVGEMACPILLFHADDDTNVLTNDITRYASALQAAGKSVQLVRVSRGGHYQSMIDHGIDTGMQFFESCGAKPLPPMTP